MPSMPAISAIIPSFNSGRLILSSIGSVLGQSHVPGEIIVVDGSGSLETEELVRSFGGLVRYIRSSGKSPSADRNTGILAATGDYLTFLDADDLWDPRKTARQLAAITSNAGARMAVCHVETLWEADLAAEAAHFQEHPRTQTVPGYCTPALMAERRLFEEIGLLNETLWYSDAFEWFMRGEQLGLAPLLLPQALLFHRQRDDGNLTRRGRDASIAEYSMLLHHRIRRSKAQAIPA